MAQQFFFTFVHGTFLNEQILPEVFAAYFRSEKDIMYLTGNNRKRYKTKITHKYDGLVLWDLEWQNFVTENVTSETKYMHFIKQGEDDYYVTVYANDGSECAGYDRILVGPRLLRCLSTYNHGCLTLLPGDFLQDIWQNHFTLIYDHIGFVVKHKRVKPYEDRVLRMNTFYGDGWDSFISKANVHCGQMLAFTLVGQYMLSVVVIGGDGLCLGMEDIRYQLLKRPPRQFYYRDRHDLRLEHICDWAYHADHVDEDNVVYTRFTGANLRIKDDFREKHKLEKCRTAKIVHRNVRGVYFQMNLELVFKRDNRTTKKILLMKGNWLDFGQDCGFEDRKMLRLKLVCFGSDPVQVPVFHVC